MILHDSDIPGYWLSPDRGSNVLSCRISLPILFACKLWLFMTGLILLLVVVVLIVYTSLLVHVIHSIVSNSLSLGMGRIIADTQRDVFFSLY